MKAWLDPQPVRVPAALRQAVGGHPLVAEILARRGVLTPACASAFLEPASYKPARPEDLPDLTVAVDRLRRAIGQGEQITVWGDFDADGQTSTSLLVESLQALGGQVNYQVPTRQQGHGLHKESLEKIISSGTRLLLTCDTGVTAHSEVEAVNARGAEVIITDHHVLGDGLPPAIAVINPHRLALGHPMHTLPGVGVAYELAKALDPAQADRSLDLVALGTVADVATLTGDARHLVQLGLEALRCTQRLGLQAIYHAAGLRQEGITEEHISFVLAPRLNSLGRLADANDGVQLLLTSDRFIARKLAAEIEGLNARRQWLTKQVTDAALAQIQREPSLLSSHEALVLNHPKWPAGIVGIVAARLAERFGKPAIVISSPPDRLAAGSGRSIPGLNLIAALTECENLFRSYGGHKAAAGFTIEPDRIPELRNSLSRAIARQAEAVPEIVLHLDAYVEIPDLTLELVTQLSRLAPFGPGNPSPTLAIRDLRVQSDTIIGRTQEHRRVTVEDQEARAATVFWWHGAEWPLPQGPFDLAVTLRTSDYSGELEPQVDWLGTRAREPETVDVPTAQPVRIRDLRLARDSRQILPQLLEDDDLQIWAEVSKPEDRPSQTRSQLVSSQRLLIWTLPPGPLEMQAALEAVQPREIILLAHNPGLDEPRAFLSRLTGLVKHVLRARQGQADLTELAAATAQRIDTVSAGLDWLEAQGHVAIIMRGHDRWLLAPGRGEGLPDKAALAFVRLRAMLTETDAYRTYASAAPATALLQLHGSATELVASP